MKIRLTSFATGDLEAIETYIAEENSDAAARTVLRVLEAVEGLLEFPSIGRPGRIPGTRELVESPTPFIVVYRVKSNILWVLRVIHGARRWPD